MAKQLIMLRSITFAYKARDLLSRNGITAGIVRTPLSRSARGCGYSVRVGREAERAREILERAGIPILGVVPEP